MKFSTCTGKFFELNKLKLKLESDLEPNSLETVSIQIKPKCAKPFVIIAWYRPPKHKIDDILNIEKLYKNHDKSNTEVIITWGIQIVMICQTRTRAVYIS